jgi:hypothetical protein
MCGIHALLDWDESGKQHDTNNETVPSVVPGGSFHLSLSRKAIEAPTDVIMRPSEWCQSMSLTVSFGQDIR